jgi:tRNA(Ile)-lysidine synthase
LLAKIQRTINRYGMAQPGASWGVAVSGGADSIALLEALTELVEQLDVSLGIVHFNHHLRGAESTKDEAFVRERAQALGLPYERDESTVDVQEGENLEAAARAARYGFFERLISQGTFDRIATGHTRSDQAETVLFRVLRGTGLAGLAAIRPVREPGIVRPLIDVTRKEVKRWLASRNCSWREDSSNQDTRFSRNRIRHNLIPQLAQEWNPQVEQALARLGDQAAAEEAYWDRIVEATIRTLVSRQTPDGIEIDCRIARELDRAVLGRCLGRLAREAKSPGRQLGTAAIEQLKAMTEQSGPNEAHLPGLTARRSCDVLRLHRPDLVAPTSPPTLAIPDADLPSPDGRSRVVLRLSRRNGDPESYSADDRSLLDWNKLPRPLHLRAWHSGDRTAESGGDCALREMFRRSGVTAWDRESWPVLVSSREGADDAVVVWSRGFGVSKAFAASSATVEILEIRELLSDGREIRRIEDWTKTASDS